MKTFIQKHPRMLVALLFLTLFLIGFLTAGDYGIYIDQQSEATILRENLKEYAYQLWGQDSEAVRYYDHIGLPRIIETAEIDHGMAAFYPLAPFMTLMDTDQAALFPLWNGLAWCWFMAGVLALYGLCRKLGMGRIAAVTGALLLYLSPRFFAEGHYNNKDMVLLSLALLTMYTGVCLWEKPALLRGLFFALMGALCANTKIIGVCIFGVMGLGAMVLLTAQRRWNLESLTAAIGTVLCFLAFYTLLTPAMWSNPAEYFQYLIANATGFTRWDNFVLFRGSMFQHSTNPLPFYYLPYMMLVTLPVYVTALCGLGQLTMLGYCWKRRKGLLANQKAMLLLCATLVWTAPLGYAIVSSPVVYNGWRHFYFVFAGLAVLGGWGLECLIRFFQRHAKRWQQIAAASLAAVCLLANTAGIAMNHPYQYGYYNALGSWLCPVPLEEGMELDYWCVSVTDGLKEAVGQKSTDTVLTYASPDPVTQLALSYYDPALPEALKEKLQLEASMSAAPDLLVVNPAYQLMYGEALPDEYELLTEIKSYAHTMVQIYHNPH